MKATLRTSFTIDQGDEITRDITVDLPIGTSAVDFDTMELMMLAADHLVDAGQVMVSSVDVITAPVAVVGDATAAAKASDLAAA